MAIGRRARAFLSLLAMEASVCVRPYSNIRKRKHLWRPPLMVLLVASAHVAMCSDIDDIAAQLDLRVNMAVDATREGLPKGWGQGVHEGTAYFFPVDAPERIQWERPEVPLPSLAEVEAAAAQAEAAHATNMQNVADQDAARGVATERLKQSTEPAAALERNLPTTKDGEFQPVSDDPEKENDGCRGEADCGFHGICIAGACSCSDGYSGATCKDPPDPCFWPVKVQCLGSSRCVDGTCTRTEKSASDIMARHGHATTCGGQTCRHGKCLGSVCHCDEGWEGATCEDLDDCHAKPCKNGGTCFDSGDVISDLGEAHAQLAEAWQGSYRCVCVTGFIGDRCQCLDCGENGRCLLSGACHCKKGFTGSRCRKNVDECASNPCGEFGTCTDGDNAYSCVCDLGYEGFWCEREQQQYGSSLRGACASSPCGQRGKCANQRGVAGSDAKYSCKCVAGWSGENCDDPEPRGRGSQHIEL